MFKAIGNCNNKIKNIESTNGLIWNIINYNNTITNRSLETVLGISGAVNIWEETHKIIKNMGSTNIIELGLGDYLDLTNGLPTPLNIEWNSNYENLRIIILGFNFYKDSNGNTLNHILWGFKNLPSSRQMNTVNNNNGGYPVMPLRTHITGDYFRSLLAALANKDYFYPVRRLVSTKGGSTIIEDKLWIPNELEMFGNSMYGEDPTPQNRIPYYKNNSQRIKKYNGSAYVYWEATVIGTTHPGFYAVGNTGNWSWIDNCIGQLGVAPHFCQI